MSEKEYQNNQTEGLVQILQSEDEYSPAQYWPFLCAYGQRALLSYRAVFHYHSTRILFDYGITVFKTDREKKWHMNRFRGNVLKIEQSLFKESGILYQAKVFRPLAQNGYPVKDRFAHRHLLTACRNLNEWEKERLNGMIRWLEDTVCYKQTFTYAILFDETGISVVFFEPEIQVMDILLGYIHEAFGTFPYFQI